MDYSIDPTRPVIDEVRRVAEEQLGRARRDLEEPGDDPVAATHDCRKRCSKLRGLARLVRPALGGGYRPANVALRDAARQLDSLRDAHPLLETFDAVVAAEPAGSSGCDLSPVRAELQTRSDEANRRAREGSGELDVAHRLLVEAEDAIATWELDESGVDAVADGLRRTYRRGRTALGSAVEDPSDERFHEYRKRTKYTWYHLRLLEPVAPSVLAPSPVRSTTWPTPSATTTTSPCSRRSCATTPTRSAVPALPAPPSVCSTCAERCCTTARSGSVGACTASGPRTSPVGSAPTGRRTTSSGPSCPPARSRTSGRRRTTASTS
jgi:CHAD domain-containing protein